MTRIYTRGGDDGTTGLGDGSRLAKHHARIEAYGTVDELCSVLGVALAQGVPDRYEALLREVQEDLFELGADLCVPGRGAETRRIGAAYTKRIEVLIDEAESGLRPLKTFILPGGRPEAAWMHLARTVCRRAERRVGELLALDSDATNAEAMRYLNRLSDLLFVLARALNAGGALDVPWHPRPVPKGGEEQP